MEVSNWIHLQQGKELSRLLYPNPVCFLCTYDGLKANVMVISWLTATNNLGRFMMSLNKCRYTANFLSKPNQEFALCVPTAGMEDLVLAVGSTSAQFGTKFRDYGHPPGQELEETAQIDDVNNTTKVLSKRQKKKQQQKEWAKGIPDLVKVSLGGNSNSTHPLEGSVFCIQGTVAHLQCRTYSVMDEAIDDEHYLILGEVTNAYCREEYWDAAKKLFRPQQGARPYLTFFGSQTFGHVH